MILERKVWLDKINAAWAKAPIVWLSGVRRVGKTSLAKSIPNAHYFNCDLPSVTERLSNPESFFNSIEEGVVIIDEIHNIPDPSRVLKIAADEFPKLKILATGSSTLSATEKFSDSLAGRKREVHLVPVLFSELGVFNNVNLSNRMLRGGLPQRLLSNDPQDSEYYSEWTDSFFARDIRELFQIEKRAQFIKLFEILLASNGELVDITKLATNTELSRPTVMNYMEALTICHAIRIIRPYHGGKRRELVRQPKVYGFDTGFIAHVRGWQTLSSENEGMLWENLVLDELSTKFNSEKIQFWRDDKKNEIDFIVFRENQMPITIECKMNELRFDPKALKVFRESYPKGKNFVVSPYLRSSYVKDYNGISVSMVNLSDLIMGLKE